MDVKEAGSLGGKATAQKMTKEQRIARAKKAVAAREAKRGIKSQKQTKAARVTV